MSQPKYTDFTDFILGITAEIWEGRGIHNLHDYYSENIPVRSPDSIVIGNKEVIRATRETLTEFPDRRCLGEDVIWDHVGKNSWFSSHRLYCTATHNGSGHFGSAKGRKVAYRVIADCHAEECPQSGWKINDEWLVRDRGAIVRCLGTTPKEFAQGLPLNLGAQSVNPAGHDRAGPYRGQGRKSELSLEYEDLINRIMHDEFSAVASHYDPACQLELPGGVTEHGITSAERFWLSLRSSFPEAEFKVYHQLGRNDDDHPPRAALRWCLRGTHSGFGMFENPTNKKKINVMGISHAEFGPRGIKREFVVFDEVSVWQQILRWKD